MAKNGVRLNTTTKPKKTLDPELREKIRLVPRAAEAAALGRTCEIRPDWEDIKVKVMIDAVKAKFDQHPILADKLVRTGYAWLVEKTSGTVRPDAVWGDGVAGEGKNYLGIILMLVRSEIREKHMMEGKLDI